MSLDHIVALCSSDMYIHDVQNRDKKRVWACVFAPASLSAVSGSTLTGQRCRLPPPLCRLATHRPSGGWQRWYLSSETCTGHHRQLGRLQKGTALYRYVHVIALIHTYACASMRQQYPQALAVRACERAEQGWCPKPRCLASLATSMAFMAFSSSRQRAAGLL